MISLRPYQAEAVEAILSFWQSGGGNPLVDLATGTGKSLVIARLTQDLLAAYPTMRVLMLVHVRELVAQNVQALLRVWPDAPVGIYSAGLGQRDAHHRITFASIQSVFRRAKAIGPRDLILIDECFVAGTPISTLFGLKPIEEIRAGDLVKNAVGYGVVRATSIRRASRLLLIRMNNGQSITCTENHPFFTDIGWVKAGELGRGSRLFGVKDVRKLRTDFQTLGEDRQTPAERKGMDEDALLLNQLLEAERECNVGAWRIGEDAGNADQNWSSSSVSVRQRERNDSASRGGPELAGVWMGGGTSCANELPQGSKNISDLLQNRRCEPGNDDCDRARWPVSFRKAIGGRQEKGRSAGLVWVESVSHEECEGNRDVFNLDVSGHPSYFAGGVLVHNCHLVPSAGNGMYRKLLDDMRAQTPDLRVAGFTATPYRLDTGRLDDGADRLFDRTVYSYGIGEGIRDGFLSPLISKASATEVDVSNVARRGGEFVAGELETATDRITAEAVAEMVRFGAERKSWLVFCSGVKNAERTRDILRAGGVNAEMVHGETPMGERDRILRDFKAGRIRALTNAQVLTTGFDAPGVDMIAMLRPTLSTSLYVQIVGRGTRLAPGKETCLVLDFAGNVRRHGPVDAVSVLPKGSGKGGDESKVAVDSVRAKECPSCASLAALNASSCKVCGHEWPHVEKPKHEGRAEDKVGILSTEAVPPQQMPVVDWRFARHEKPGSPDSLRVTYLAGLNAINEWIALEHGGYAAQKAQQWWVSHGGGTPMPRTVGEALERAEAGELVMPATIAVKPDGKFMRIVGRSFPRKAA